MNDRVDVNLDFKQPHDSAENIDAEFRAADCDQMRFHGGTEVVGDSTRGDPFTSRERSDWNVRCHINASSINASSH